MVGVTHLGTYFPRRRLDRALIGQAWGSRAPAGKRAVAGIDEDALTMAIDAGRACLDERELANMGALYFASTSSPYREKQCASLIATALDLPRSAAVADIGGSVRAGTTALRAALDAVGAGSVRRALVTAADVRLGEPESELEGLLGDGAAAVAVGEEEVIAELVGTASVAEEFTYLWRTEAQRFVQASEPRFGTQYGYVRDVAEAVTAALQQAEVPPTKIAYLALGAPDLRAASETAKKIGCDPARLVASLVSETGILGTAEPLALLARALGAAAPGEFVVVAAYGEGADALVLRTTDLLPHRRPRPLAERLGGGLPLASYAAYLRARGVFPADTPGELVTSILEWKELKQDVRFYGSRCSPCGLVQYPQARVCIGCGARDQLVEHKLERRGTVFTFTIDNLAPVAEHPMPMLVIDLDGGGRVYLQGTDAAQGEVKVGTRVILTFRRLHEHAGKYNYFWKARPE